MLGLTISSTGDVNLEFYFPLSPSAPQRRGAFTVDNHQSLCLRHIFIKTAVLKGRRLSEISRYNSA